MTTERYKRQHDLISEELLSSLRIAVIGIGAIGRQVALQLTAIGTMNITVVDPEIIEEVNLATQGWYENDIDSYKVTIIRSDMIFRNSAMDITPYATKFKRSMVNHDIVFCCVDSMETRKFIFGCYKNKAKLFIDGRMAAEVMRILSVDMTNSEQREHYETTLFRDSEAFPESCTAKSTIYCANIAAGLMVSQLTAWMRKFPLNNDILFNLLSMEI